MQKVFSIIALTAKMGRGWLRGGEDEVSTRDAFCRQPGHETFENSMFVPGLRVFCVERAEHEREERQKVRECARETPFDARC